MDGMARRLLDRQASLIEHLTSGATIFGDRSGAIAPALRQMARGPLRLEARFSFDKRMEKITAAFPRTFRLLEDQREEFMRKFADACPPVDITRIANVRQFHAFLSARWRRKRPKVPYLPDVANCELACAEVRARIDLRPDDSMIRPLRPRRRVRRHPGAVLLRCRFDIRSIFEDGAAGEAPTRRDTRLVVHMPAGIDNPRVFEIERVAFDVLSALDGWVDAAELGQALEPLVRELAEHALIEVGA
jgi:hypothetical protein